MTSKLASTNDTTPLAHTELAALLISLGCPADKSAEMAAQLDKRARQLAQHDNRGHGAALAHLLGLMKQGWSAKERGL